MVKHLSARNLDGWATCVHSRELLYAESKAQQRTSTRGEDQGVLHDILPCVPRRRWHRTAARVVDAGFKAWVV